MIQASKKDDKHCGGAILATEPHTYETSHKSRPNVDISRKGVLDFLI